MSSDLEEVVGVEEVKVFKASPRVYNLASERLRVTNPELGFVSANNWDAVGALSAGLRTFWIQRATEEVPEELGFQADTVVKALTELAPLLRGWPQRAQFDGLMAKPAGREMPSTAKGG